MAIVTYTLYGEHPRYREFSTVRQALCFVEMVSGHSAYSNFKMRTGKFVKGD